MRKIGELWLAWDRGELEEPAVEPAQPGSSAYLQEHGVLEGIDRPKRDFKGGGAGDRFDGRLRKLLQPARRNLVSA